MKDKIIKLTSLIFFLFLILSSFKLEAIAAPLREGRFAKAKYVQDEIIVRFKKDVRPFRVIKVPKSRVREKVEEYLKKEEIEYAEPNYYAYALMVPNDEFYQYQWHLDNVEYGGINMEAAWDISSGSGVTIAIVDTGVAYEDYCERSSWRRICYEQAPDLAESCFAAGYDFINKDSHPNDDSSPGHGTHIAGTIAQSTNNSMGTAGVAFNTCLMPVKVLDKTGTGTYAEVAEGIYFAVDNGARVINLSLGGKKSSETLKDAVAYAYEKGVIVIAAAGNDGSNILSYPSAYDDYVIAVGATQYDENLAPYSNYGLSLDLVAPGGNNNLDQNNDGYVDGVLQQTYEKSGWRGVSWGYYFMQGTSMATPHVSGLTALILANGNASTPDEVRSVLQNTAEDHGPTGWDETYGWGIVNAAAALGVIPTLVPSPSPSPTPSSTPSPIPSPSPLMSPSPIPSPSPSPTPAPETGIACWSGDYQYLYRDRNQLKKFCKCAEGNYGYKSYKYSWRQKTVHQYVDSGDNENWETASKSSRRAVYQATCTDGKAYKTDQDYY